MAASTFESQDAILYFLSVLKGNLHILSSQRDQVQLLHLCLVAGSLEQTRARLHQSGSRKGAQIHDLRGQRGTCHTRMFLNFNLEEALTFFVQYFNAHLNNKIEMNGKPLTTTIITMYW